MKKVYLAICIIALISCLTGIPHLIDGIALRGLGGVNYGPVILPFLISAVFFRLYRKNRNKE